MDSSTKLLCPDVANEIKAQIYQKPLELQQQVLSSLIEQANNTRFGIKHQFSKIKNTQDYKNYIPVRDYEDFDSYFNLMYEGTANVLWPGVPSFLATTSASTGYPKYIPITNESIMSFIELATRSMMQYVYDEHDYDLMNHSIINLSGSSNLKQFKSYLTGSVSGICSKMLPDSLSSKSLPSMAVKELMETDGWDVMFEKAAMEAKQHSASVCNGLPSWMLQFFLACQRISQSQDLSRVLPELRLLCTSGVSNKPYRGQFQAMFAQKIHFREFYGASEGAFAYQDNGYDESMLLNLAGGIYYEFIKLEHANDDHPIRISLENIELNTLYVPVITTNAGLWAYKMGDIIKFSSMNPFKIDVVGRTKHFIAIASEYVYSRNVEDAMTLTSKELELQVINFTVAPNCHKNQTKPYYTWYIELKPGIDINMKQLAFKLDYYLRQVSISYSNARSQAVLAQPKVLQVKPKGFLSYLKQKDQSSLQLKIPKLMNERILADYFHDNALIAVDEEVLG